MKTIWKKILPWYFEAVRNGSKTFEIRKDEDGFEVGDHIILCEWSGTAYTGFTLEAEVTYILRDAEQYGLMPGFCILGIKALEGKDTNVPTWIPVSERMPTCEQEVLICTKVKLVGKDAFIDSIITPAFYEDGTMLENDSRWSWEEVDWAGWDEEEDCGIIPEGWWENRHFNPDDLLNCPVDREVVAWMPLPEPYKEEQNHE